jgi:ribosomal protein S18 acetylase RimI-like enzyme
MIREAVLDDVPALVELETRCFDTDRLSARSFRHFLRRGNDDLLVAELDGAVRAYSLTLFRRNTSLARLYSIAVDPACRGRHVARELLQAAQVRALDRGTTRMRLEVHQRNEAAQELYRSLGYRGFGVFEDYYEDHATALRMEKELAPHLAPDLDRVPWYRQTLEFTCGPACLIMAMKAHDPALEVDRDLEIQLWREATTVFMTSGHGGCAPLGLALAAWRRGFDVETSVSDETELFTDSVRSEDKKAVIRLVERRFLVELGETGILIDTAPPSAADLVDRLARGGMPLVLISSYRLTGDRIPHWVLITAADAGFVYINDPFVDEEEGRTETDCIGIPIQPHEFERMMRLGRRKHHASVIVYPRREEAAA